VNKRVRERGRQASVRSERVRTLVGALAVLLACTNEIPTQETATSREGLTTSLVALADTGIIERQPTVNSGNSASCFVNGSREGVGMRSCLFRWPTGLPSHAVVQAAQLRFTVPDLPDAQTGENYSVWRVLRTWSNSGATWDAALSLTGWQVPGALGTADRGPVVGSLIGDNLTGDHVVSLNSAGIAMVQSWITDPSSNRGVIVADSTSQDIVRLSTSNSSVPSARPTLEITYTCNVASGAGGTTVDAGIGGSGGAQCL
jgi:hypothetical protein